LQHSGFQDRRLKPLGHPSACWAAICYSKPAHDRGGPILKEQRQRDGYDAFKVSGPDGAARRLGLPASTLESKIKKLGIEKFCFKSALRLTSTPVRTRVH
jgi:hypothetical protein